MAVATNVDVDGARERTGAITWLILVLLALVLAGAVAVIKPWDRFLGDDPVEAFTGAGLPAATVESLERAAAKDQVGSDPVPDPGMVVTSRGAFHGRTGHDAAGEAVLMDAPDGRRFLRLEQLDVANGPDLRVYLSVAAPDFESSAFAEDFVNLGGLVYNVGDSHYEISADVDVSRFRSVVIWSEKHGLTFAVAPLHPPSAPPAEPPT